MVDESALACLEEAVMRLADTNESDEELGDNMSVYDEGHEEGENDASSLGRSYAPTQSVFPGVPKANAAPMVSLSKIMADGHSFQLFRRFLKDQCISRNLNFWLTCEAYRTQAHESNMERRTEIAKSIYMKFLKSSAPLHVNILDQTRRDISLAIRLVDPSPQLFDDAQQEVYEMMEANEFRQFLCSDTFSECSLFSQGDGDTLLNGRMPLGFRPAMYRGGSLHSGSDDTTSVTSFTSDSEVMATRTQVLCLPAQTRLIYPTRNAYSDTENSRKARYPIDSMTNFSKSKRLTQQQFYEVLYGRLSAVPQERVNMKQRAMNSARKANRPFEEIMSQEWYDSPDACRYVQFDKEAKPDERIPPVEVVASPMIESQQQQQQQHILNVGMREIQDAIQDMNITKQVRKRATSAASSSASSYPCDSGVGESWVPSSSQGKLNSSSDDVAARRVEKFVHTQRKYNSQLSERDAQCHAAAMAIMHSSVPSDDIVPQRHPYYHPGTYSSGDDNSSCFTANSQSSNSEFFIPRRSARSQMMTDSADEPSSFHRMRRLSHPRKSAQHSSSTRYLAAHGYPPQHHHTQPVPPMGQPRPPRAISPSAPVHPAPSNPSPIATTLLVAYTMDGYGQTMAKRVPCTQLTLGEFREKVFARRGSYRFFFKTYCEDIGNIMEEISDNSVQLPLFEGKIMGHVEKMDCFEA